jgi:hypothetical protein
VSLKSIRRCRTSTSLQREKTVVNIYFRAKESTFHAELPRHIVEGVGRHPERGEKMRGSEIVSLLADDVQPAYEHVLKLFERIQQNAVKKKVIKVFMRANGRNTQFFKSIGFVDTSGPALAFSYRILWQIGDGLYSQSSSGRDSETPYMTYITRAPKPDERVPGNYGKETFVLDWTEEREEFFANIKQGLETLIGRLADVLGGDVGQTVDRLIAGGGSLMLPAPQPENA